MVVTSGAAVVVVVGAAVVVAAAVDDVVVAAVVGVAVVTVVGAFELAGVDEPHEARSATRITHLEGRMVANLWRSWTYRRCVAPNRYRIGATLE